MTMILKLAASAAVAFALATGSAAAQAETLKFGFAAEPYPPFTEASASGEWKGFEIDFTNALCEEMNVTCEPSPVAWDGIIPALTSGKIDMIIGSMSITEERKQTISFSDRYYYTSAAFVAPKNSGLEVSEAGLNGKVLGVQSGTTNADYAEKAYGESAEIKLYNTQDEVNADLAAGRIDAMIADQIAMDAFLKSDQGTDMEIVATAPADPAFGEGIGVGVRKDDTELLGKINSAIKSLRESGKYDEIARKYFAFDIYGPQG